jgi:hypothetical protein
VISPPSNRTKVCGWQFPVPGFQFDETQNTKLGTGHCKL